MFSAVSCSKATLSYTGMRSVPCASFLTGSPWMALVVNPFIRSPFWLSCVHLLDHDLFVVEALACFIAREFERVGLRGLALIDAGNQIGTACPMRFFQITGRPVRGIVGVRMV